MKILAIDPGTKLGWASDVSGRLEWGEHDFALRRGESPGIRYHNFNVWLGKMAGLEEMEMYAFLLGGIGPLKPHAEPFYSAPELIVYELPHLRGGAASDVLIGMTTRILEFAALWSKCRPMECLSVHTQTLKKFATGSGRSEKGAMVDRAASRLVEKQKNPAGLTDNSADALHLYWYAKHLYGGSNGQR